MGITTMCRITKQNLKAQTAHWLGFTARKLCLKHASKIFMYVIVFMLKLRHTETWYLRTKSTYLEGISQEAPGAILWDLTWNEKIPTCLKISEIPHSHWSIHSIHWDLREQGLLPP